MDRTDWIYDLGTIWRAASEIFPYFDCCDMDWDEKYREYLEKISEASDDRQAQLVMAEFINLLGDGHTDLMFSQAVKKGFLPFGFLYSGGKYYVNEIAKDGEEFLFAQVLSINGRAFEDILSDLFRYIYHVGSYAWPGRIRGVLPVLLKEKDNVLETDRGDYSFDLCAEVPDMAQPEPAHGAQYDAYACQWPEIRLYNGGKLYVKIDDWMHAKTAERLKKALAELSPREVIIDIRRNIGGMTMIGAEVAALFISGEIHSCQKKTRSMRGIDMACASQYAGMSEEELSRYDKDDGFICSMNTGRRVNFEEYTDCWSSPEKRAEFDGPVTILASRDTISAAEDFLAMFKVSGRAKIIGTPSCGTTGTPLLKKLRCGAAFRVCSVAYRLLDGTEFIRKGIEPDLYMEQDIELLRQGRDNILEYALK